MVNKHFFGIFLNLNVALVVFGFQTPSCTNEQLEANLAEYFKCTYEHANKEMDAIFGLIRNQQNNKALGCAFLDKEIACFRDNIGTCFDEEVSNDMATLMDAAYKDVPYVQCKRIGGSRGAQIGAKVRSIADKYKRNPEKLNSIITMDNQCSDDLLIQSLENDMTCLANQVKTSFKELGNSIRSLIRESRTPLPICSMIVDALSCISASQCLSQNEVDFIKNIAATTYNLVMKTMNEIYQRAGGRFEELVKLVDADEELDSYTYEQKLKIYKTGDNLLKAGFDDYKASSCQSKLEQFDDYLTGEEGYTERGEEGR